MYIINLDVMFFGWGDAIHSIAPALLYLNLCFVSGAVLALNNVRIDYKPPRPGVVAIVVIWLLLCLIKTVLAYDTRVSNEALTTMYKVRRDIVFSVAETFATLCPAFSFFSFHQMTMIPGIFAFWWGSDLVFGGFDEAASSNSTVLPSSSATSSELQEAAIERNGCGTFMQKLGSSFRRFIDWGRLHFPFHLSITAFPFL